MNTERLLPLAPEQIQALTAGHGSAEFIDPATQCVYKVAEKRPHPREMPEDETLQRELDEAAAQIARGEVSTRSISKFIADAERQLGHGTLQ